MPTFEEYVSDPKTYPNDTTVRLADGSETTLGQIRAGYMKDADYRRKTAEVARARQELADKEAAIADAQQRLTLLAERMVQQKPEASQEELNEEFANDATARKLAAKLEQLQNVIVPMAKSMVELDDRLKQQQLGHLTEQHQRVIAKLKEGDPELDVQELISYAKTNYIPRLDLAHRAMKYDEAVKEAVARGKEEGLKLGKESAQKEMVAPSILPSRRPVAPAADAPKTLEEAVSRAMTDPDIMGPLQGVGLGR